MSVQIFEFFFRFTLQTLTESFYKSVNLNEERAVKQSRTVPNVEGSGHAFQTSRFYHIETFTLDFLLFVHAVRYAVFPEGRIKVPLRQCFHGLVYMHYSTAKLGVTGFMHLSLNAYKGQLRTFVAKRDCREYALFWSRFSSDFTQINEI